MFKLVYSRDGTSWIPLTPKISEAATEFAGPTQQNAFSMPGNKPKEYTFPSTSYPGIGAFEARYVRVYIVQAANWGESTVSRHTIAEPTTHILLYGRKDLHPGGVLRPSASFLQPTLRRCDFRIPSRRCRADGLVPVGIASFAIPDSAMTQVLP